MHLDDPTRTGLSDKEASLKLAIPPRLNWEPGFVALASFLSTETGQMIEVALKFYPTHPTIRPVRSNRKKPVWAEITRFTGNLPA
jgi:hypothetical protein